MGLQILDILEAIHSTGHVYNNLKLENVALDVGQKMTVNKHGIVTYEKGTRLNLLDFSKISLYVD